MGKLEGLNAPQIGILGVEFSFLKFEVQFIPDAKVQGPIASLNHQLSHIHTYTFLLVFIMHGMIGVFHTSSTKLKALCKFI